MLVPITLVVSIVLVRLLPLIGDQSGLAFVANLSPLVALTLTGTAFFRKGWLMFLPLIAFLLSDLILNAVYSQPLLAPHTLVALVIYGVIAATGLLVRKTENPLVPVLGATIGGVLLFYLVTNTVSFFMYPGYPRSFEGWMQCLTVGLPGYPPTWSFLLKGLISNTIFAAIFCRMFTGAPDSERLPAGELTSEQQTIAS